VFNFLKFAVNFTLATLIILVLTNDVFTVGSARAENPLHAPQTLSSLVVLSANKSVVKNSFTRREIRAIFTMRLTRWPNGQPITVFVINDDNPAHIQFCKNILNIFPHQLRAAWNKLEFSGTGQGPIELSSLLEMQQALIATPNSIGYLKENTNDASLQTLEFR